jgi:hypothetical protein
MKKSSPWYWGPTTKRNAITALQRAFNWAVKNRGPRRIRFTACRLEDLDHVQGGTIPYRLSSRTTRRASATSSIRLPVS